MFSGSFVALVTPFKKGEIDEGTLRRLVDFHLKSETAGLVPCGSTGEAATLKPEEYLRVIRIVAEEAAGRIPVVPGVGSNATWKTVEAVREVGRLKVDGMLVIVPYYNKPTQEGQKLHFGEVAKAAKAPVIVYNIPGRTGVNMKPETLAALAKKHKNIIGVKEASGDLDQVSDLLNLVDDRFCVLSGDDSSTLPMLALGAQGVISVAANVAPREMSRMCRAYLGGRVQEARGLHRRLLPLMRSLFVETNPIPVKAALGMLKLCAPELRLPLTPLAAAHRLRVTEVLKDLGLF